MDLEDAKVKNRIFRALLFVRFIIRKCVKLDISTQSLHVSRKCFLRFDFEKCKDVVCLV